MRLTAPRRLSIAVVVLGLCAPVPAVAAQSAGSAPATTAHTAAKPAKKGGRRCVGRRPTLIAFTPSASRMSGVVSWKRPLRPRTGKLHYRVLRDGATIGQTRYRRMAVRVRPGGRVRFTVQTMLANGRPTGCATTLAYDLRREPPSPPRDLVASDVSESGATLTWTAGTVRVGKLAGHRVFRDGEPLRQVPGTSLRVALSATRSYTYTVATVDTTGYVSRLSAPVTIRTGHGAPSAPRALTSSNVSDSSFDLQWGASTPTGGRIVGYRVYRDALLLRQVPETSISVTGLAPAQSYALTVTAIDSLGYESKPSDALAVGTQRPTPTTGGVHAFLLATTGGSFTGLREHYRQIGTVYPTYFECAPDGTVAGHDDPLVTRWAQLRDIRVMPRLDCQSSTRLHAILTDPGIRGAVIGRLSELVTANGYDGVNIDFEAGLASDKAALTSFVADLANLLHGQGKRVSVAVSPTTKTPTSGRAAFYDYPALGQSADTVFVMNWGKHWSTSTPGAISDLPWATEVADFIATMPNHERYVLGAGLYGMDWPAGGGPQHPATPLEWADVQNLIAAVGANPTIDPISGAPHFSYTDAAGVPHEVWYTDATSLAAPIRLAAARGLGFGVWRLGREDPGLWDDTLLAPGAAWPR